MTHASIVPPLAGKLKRLWILTSTGIPIKTVDFRETPVDPGHESVLLGGFISAIQGLSREIGGAEAYVKSITVGHLTYHLLLSDTRHVCFVVESDALPEEVVTEFLTAVHAKFKQRYPMELVAHWSGDLSAFEGFQEEIVRILEEQARKRLNRWDIFEILSDRAHALTPIAPDQVHGLLFVAAKRIRRIYQDTTFTGLDIRACPALWAIAEVGCRAGADLGEFFLRFTDYWIAGMRFAEFELYLVVSPEIDVDHLKTQMMFILEHLVEDLGDEV